MAAFGLALGSAGGLITVWGIYSLAGLLGASRAFEWPAAFA